MHLPILQADQAFPFSRRRQRPAYLAQSPINQIVNGLVDLLFAGSFRRNATRRKNPLPEIRRYAFYADDGYDSFAIISPSRTLSPIRRG